MLTLTEPVLASAVVICRKHGSTGVSGENGRHAASQVTSAATASEARRVGKAGWRRNMSLGGEEQSTCGANGTLSATSSAMLLSHCPLCVSRRLRYAFSQNERRAVRCADCQLLFLNPQRDDDGMASASATAAQASQFLTDLARYRSVEGGRLLLISETGSPLHNAAEYAGFEVTVARDAGRHDGAQFDLALLDHALGRTENPVAFLQSLHGAVKAGGAVGLVAPPLDFSGPLFTAGELHRFDARTLQTALFFAGFGEVVVEGPRFVFSRALPLRERRLLSLVVPAYNEAASLEALLDSLIAKELPRLDIEIIVVESNSTDGTREIAVRYAEHPRVRVILEDRPRGKGHAVRTGLAEANGDFILIQDADLEYDLEDYDALLEPLITGREAFVLGSRHSGSVWKMRQFYRPGLAERGAESRPLGLHHARECPLSPAAEGPIYDVQSLPARLPVRAGL